MKHQEVLEDTTVLSLLLRGRFYIQGNVGIRSLFDTMQVPFHCRTFPDCEPRNHVPRNYLGFAETAANARDVMEISTGLPCP